MNCDEGGRAGLGLPQSRSPVLPWIPPVSEYGAGFAGMTWTRAERLVCGLPLRLSRLARRTLIYSYIQRGVRALGRWFCSGWWKKGCNFNESNSWGFTRAGRIGYHILFMARQPRCALARLQVLCKHRTDPDRGRCGPRSAFGPRPFRSRSCRESKQED